MIRKACMEETEELLAIYDSCRAYMRSHGNMTQWAAGYPWRELVQKDIAQGRLYVIERDGELRGVFFCAVIDDPSYHVIDGRWNYDESYAVIHRIGSAGRGGGVVQEALDFALTLSPYVRVDTHEDNKPMRSVLERLGFRYTGIIICGNGTPRVAYDFKKERRMQNIFWAKDSTDDVGGVNVVRNVRAHNENMMLCELHFAKGGEGKPHTHVHEQISYVVSGKFEYTIEEESWVLCPGDSVYVQSGVVHGCKALEEGVLLDIFTPERKDFLK